MNTRKTSTGYTFVGAGPANIILITHLIGQGVDPKNITLIGDQKSGAFANDLSVGSSVPGNTPAGNYKKVYEQIYKMVPALRPEKSLHFKLNDEKDETACTLDTAAEPLRYISNKICHLVNFHEGRVPYISKSNIGWKVDINLTSGAKAQPISTKKVILGIGGVPGFKDLPKKYSSDIEVFHPNIVFIYTELVKYLHGSKPTVAVIGSSHSAALATMHLLQTGCTVIQFMNKEYVYAEKKEKDGKPYMEYDDTGLKGNVAFFTKKLLADNAEQKGEYHARLTRYIGKDNAEVDKLLQDHLGQCTHVISTIGYDPIQTVKIEGFPEQLTRENYDKRSMQFFKPVSLSQKGVEKNEPYEGLFGNGLAFAEEVNGAQANGLGKYNATAERLAKTLAEKPLISAKL